MTKPLVILGDYIWRLFGEIWSRLETWRLFGHYFDTITRLFGDLWKQIGHSQLKNYLLPYHINLYQIAYIVDTNEGKWKMPISYSIILTNNNINSKSFQYQI